MQFYSVWLPRHVVVVKVICVSALIKFSSEEEANPISKLNMVYDGVDMEMSQSKDEIYLSRIKFMFSLFVLIAL